MYFHRMGQFKNNVNARCLTHVCQQLHHAPCLNLPLPKSFLEVPISWLSSLGFSYSVSLSVQVSKTFITTFFLLRQSLNVRLDPQNSTSGWGNGELKFLATIQESVSVKSHSWTVCIFKCKTRQIYTWISLSVRIAHKHPWVQSGVQLEG